MPKRIKTYTEAEAKQLPGLLECISEKAYAKSRAIARCNGKLPRDLTPGGVPCIIELDGSYVTSSGRRVKRYESCWYVADAND